MESYRGFIGSCDWVYAETHKNTRTSEYSKATLLLLFGLLVEFSYLHLRNVWGRIVGVSLRSQSNSCEAHPKPRTLDIEAWDSGLEESRA